MASSCRRETWVRWLCGRTGQHLQEVTVSVIRTARRGALTGDCLQRDTSAAASVTAVSCQFSQFYGTFITICHSFNGMVCSSYHLPPATPLPPTTYTHRETLWGAQPYGAEWARLHILFFWAHLEGLPGTVARQGGPGSSQLWRKSRNQTMIILT